MKIIKLLTLLAIINFSQIIVSGSDLNKSAIKTLDLTVENRSDNDVFCLQYLDPKLKSRRNFKPEVEKIKTAYRIEPGISTNDSPIKILISNAELIKIATKKGITSITPAHLGTKLIILEDGTIKIEK